MPNLLISFFIFFACFFDGIQAKNFGTLGHTYPIEERDLLEVIQEKLASRSEDEILSYVWQRQDFVPKPLKRLKECKKPRSFYFDPTVVLKEDILDAKGKVIIPKGTAYNPLESFSLNNPLLFLNGEDENHIRWASNQEDGSVWILSKGDPFKLSGRLGRAIKFDQGGTIVKRLKIKHIPAKVVQEKIKLRIEETPAKIEK